MKWLILMVGFLLLPFWAFAQEAGITPPTEAEIGAFIAALGGLGSLKGLALVAVIAQGVALILRTSAGELAGKWRLLIIVLVNLVGGFVTLKIQGSDTVSALLHPTMLAAIQVFVNQLYIQFFKKDE